MKPLLVLMIVLAAAVVFAGQAYYQFPETDSLNDGDRILVFDNISSTSRNITGAKIKQEAVSAVNAPSDNPLVKQPATSTNPYQRVMEIKDANGVIKQWSNAKGQLYFGTPKALAVTAVSPANGATGVDVATVPSVTINKASDATISTILIVGSSTDPATSDGGITWTIPATLAASTTYTIRVVKNSIVQTDGETTSSCGTVMTDNAGVCESTFTTAP